MAGRGRTGADEQLAAELASGKTIRDAAAAAGVSETTAYRRLANAEFKARVSELRGQMVSTAAGRLATSMGCAADVLTALLTNRNPTLRLRAAGKLLEMGLKVVEVAELEQRVVELEKRLKE